MASKAFTQEQRIRADRLRRMAQRQGLTLTRNRRYDPHAADYGAWTLKNGRKTVATFTRDDLDAIENHLTGGGR